MWGLAWAVPIVKWEELVPKHPWGVETFNDMKSSVSGGKDGSTASLRRKFVDM